MKNVIQLTEQHVISCNHKFYDEIDALCFKSKNLYNSCNYFIRQRFFDNQSTSLKELYHYIKECDEYSSLPRKVSNEVLKMTIKNWNSYYQALKAYKKNPSLFVGCPSIPNYKDKDSGKRN